jgi:exodeoxyribonuclease VII large subunit
VGVAGRELDAERRVLDGLNPTARLAASRQLAGDLLDRASRAIRTGLAAASSMEDRLAASLPVLASAALGRRRAALAESAAALGVLGPQATLERGYAIVRRSADGVVVRQPAEAPPGTALSLRVAGGELPARADDRPR